MSNSFPQKNIQILQLILNLPGKSHLEVHVTKIMDNFLKNCLVRMEEFRADILVFFITS